MNLREALQSTKILLIALILFIIFRIAFNFVAEGLGDGILTLQLTFSGEEFRRLAEAWEEQDLLAIYFNHFYLDFLYPIIYGTFIASLLAKAMTLKNISQRANFLITLPFVAALLDMTENSLHIYMLTDFSRISDSMVWVSGAITHTKWVLAMGAFALALVMFLIPKRKKGLGD